MGKKILTHASVFSGIGGPEVAATMLGWENLFHCEINPFGRAVLDYWYPDSKSYEDITKTDFSEWRGRVNVLTGGFPCQPFSYAGQRRGAQDDRYLWPFMFKAIDTIRPDWVVAENVAGITTMVEQGEVSSMGTEQDIFSADGDIHRYRLTSTFTLQRICTDLANHGYAVQPVLVPACAVGAPHRRDRVFIVARRKEESAAADSVGSGERTPRPSGEPESGRGDTHQQPSERRAATERLDRLHAVLRHAADTEGEPSERLRPRQSEVGRAQQEQSGGRGGESGSERLAPHPDSHRGSEVDEHMESELADGAKPVSNGGQRNVADTDNERQPGRCSEDRGEWSDIARVIRREFLGIAEGHHDYEVGERWSNFPSVSPVHRGNDGLSVPPYYDAIFQTRNNMDRNSVIQGALSTEKIEVDFETGKIYSSRIRGHEGKKILLQGSECNGYIVHTLSFNGIKKQCRAHQIVWIAANGLYDKDKWQIDHVNRDRKDNRLCNLRLVSAAENIANSDRPDTRMLGDEERIKIWQMYNEGHMSLREIAEDYGVSKSYIHKIVSDFPSLTLSFGKWRTEALKAYGNAIVPEVMYEIFRAIKITEETWNFKDQRL